MAKNSNSVFMIVLLIMNTEFEFLAIKYATELLHSKAVLEYSNAQPKSGV